MDSDVADQDVVVSKFCPRCECQRRYRVVRASLSIACFCSSCGELLSRLELPRGWQRNRNLFQPGS